MTIASEITRLQWAKATARTSIINKGVDVPTSASVEDYHTYIDLIQQWWDLESIIQYIRDKWYVSLNLWREIYNAYSTYDWNITTNTDTVYDWWTILAFNTSFIRNSSHGMRSIATAYGYKNWVFRKAHFENWQTSHTNQWYWWYSSEDWHLWYHWDWNSQSNYHDYYRVIFSESENPNDSYFEKMYDRETQPISTFTPRYSWAWIKTVQIPVWGLTANRSMNAQWTWWADVSWYIA